MLPTILEVTKGVALVIILFCSEFKNHIGESTLFGM
jgi:hypothetical protein